jgi:hypothetical protein
MANQSSSLTRFSVKPPLPPQAVDGEDTLALNTSGSNKRKAVAVRLSREDWCRAKEFAFRSNVALQTLFVLGVSELMKQKGLPPLDGDNFKN